MDTKLAFRHKTPANNFSSSAIISNLSLYVCCCRNFVFFAFIFLSVSTSCIFIHNSFALVILFPDWLLFPNTFAHLQVQYTHTHTHIHIPTNMQANVRLTKRRYFMARTFFYNNVTPVTFSTILSIEHILPYTKYQHVPRCVFSVFLQFCSFMR